MTTTRRSICFVILSLFVLLIPACGGADPQNETPTPTVIQLLPEFATVTPGAGADLTQEAQSQGSGQPEGPPGDVPLGRRIRVGDVSLKVPRDWHWAEVSLAHLESLLFMEQDPGDLAEFDDPDLAVPVGFKAGALIVTTASDGVDALEWQQSAAVSYADLEDEDLAALLLAIDQVGLINFAAVEEVSLVGTSLEILGGQFALKLEGEIFFGEDAPPILHVVVWLCRVESRFVGYYALASEEVWQSSEAVFLAIAETIQFR